MAVVSDYTALLSGATWWGEIDPPAKPVFLTYSFETAPQDYLGDYDFSARYIGSFRAFTAGEQALARDALQQWDAASGVRFFEVPAGQGDLRFARYNFAYDQGMDQFAGYSYYPYSQLAPDAAWDDFIAGDAFFNTRYAITLGLLLHEIGHALGLKHPFEEDPTLSPALDDSAYTVMSYDGLDPTALAQLDLDAIAALYGPPGADGAHVADWSWDADTFTLTQAGGAGADTMRGVATADVIEGNGGADLLYGGAGDDRLIGGAGDDLLFGDTGADTLIGGPGDDRLHGLSGLVDDSDGGADAVAFSGARSEYDVRTSRLADGALETRVVHAGGSAAEGSDTLLDIEALQFSGAAVALAGAQLNRASNVAGSRFDDVVFQHATDGQVVYARMVDGAFQEWSAATAALGPGWTAIATGNVDPGSAGGAEIFVQQAATGAIYYASLDAGATTWGTVSTGLTADWILRAVADVNGDASVDALVQNAADGTIYFADMQDGVFRAWHAVSRSLSADWVAVGAGDINADGFADVVVQQQSTGATVWADMAGGAFAGWGVVSLGLTPDWVVRAVADMTGDGRADIVWQNSAGGGGFNPGTTYYGDLASGAVRYGVVTDDVSAEWQAGGAADVDNDGYADVLFQNQNDGATLFADMGPDGFEAWGAVSTHLNAEWLLV